MIIMLSLQMSIVPMARRADPSALLSSLLSALLFLSSHLFSDLYSLFSVPVCHASFSVLFS